MIISSIQGYNHKRDIIIIQPVHTLEITAMAKEKKSNNPQPPKPSLLQALMSRAEWDKDYKGDLQEQWESMNNGERAKFIAGVFFAFILLVAALVGVYFLINFLRQWIFASPTP